MINSHLTYKRCSKIYEGSTVTSFRKSFNDHKSSLKRFGKGQRGIAGEHFYAYFYEEGHKGIEDIQVKIIHRTDVNDPNTRLSPWFSASHLLRNISKALNSSISELGGLYHALMRNYLLRCLEISIQIISRQSKFKSFRSQKEYTSRM